ncbi:hypothetical protein, partial [Shewanella algae]|uniref:hypothetical protein n=1 Tax=Shewanella algae TaxID=38313 RepID=UPI00313D5C1D
VTKKQFDYVIVAGPENQSVYPDIKEKVQALSQAKNLIWLTACRSKDVDSATTQTLQIPMKTYVEKSGSFTNYKGLTQSFPFATAIVP